MATTLRACNGIKGAASLTKLESDYTRNIDELSQVSLAILFTIFP